MPVSPESIGGSDADETGLFDTDLNGSCMAMNASWWFDRMAVM